ETVEEGTAGFETSGPHPGMAPNGEAPPALSERHGLDHAGRRAKIKSQGGGMNSMDMKMMKWSWRHFERHYHE
ncbi:hypothetical protein V4886_25135, partial [Ralstonia solanacearum species complex bacterium RW470]|uniref:hypothetical protein n=1 Tax=Ralstonia solanacearum species complex bacterium RW470 TaxID=3119580 RepID=UPI002FC2C30F